MSLRIIVDLDRLLYSSSILPLHLCTSLKTDMSPLGPFEPPRLTFIAAGLGAVSATSRRRRRGRV